MRNRVLSYWVYLIPIFIAPDLFAQLDLGLGYVYSDPRNTMGIDIERAHGFNVNLAYQIPESQFQFLAGASFSKYGSEDYNRDLIIDDELITNLDVNINRSLCKTDQ